MLSVSLALNGPQTIVPGATINVSGELANDQSEMSLVVNPTNPLNVVGFSHRLRNPITMDVYASFDGGLTWSTNEINNADDGLGTVGNRFDPSLQFDANGVLYIAYGYRGQATAPLRNTLLIVARSNDGGVNFGNYVTVDQQADILTANPTDTDTPGLDKWYVATGLDPVSGNQAVYLAYVAFVTEGTGLSAGADAHISVIGSNDGGANWTPRLVVNDNAAGVNFDSASYASPIVDSLGRLAVSWWDNDNDSIVLDRDTDGLWGGGAAFGADITVRTGIDLDRATDQPPAQPERGINPAPMLEVWRAVNWLYITVAEKYQGSSTDLDIWVGVSSDFGENWTFNRIDDSGGTEFNPWLQVDQTTGAVNVLYYTTEGDVGTGNDDVRPRLAMSNDGGATWTRTFLSTQQSNEGPDVPMNGDYDGDYLEYHGLAARDGTVHGLWPSRYMGGGTDLDAFTANAAFVSSIGDNRLFIGGSGGIDDSFLVQQSPANPAFLEVFVDGVREFTGLSATLDHIIFNPGGGINTFNIGSLTGISSVTINGTSNIDTYDIVSLGLNAPLSIVLGGDDDTVTLGSSPFASQLIQSAVTVFGDAGNDTLFLGSNNADSIDANVTFNGGTSVGAVGDRIVFNDTAPSYNVSYDITSTFVTRDGFNLPRTVSYSNTDGIVLNCGSGADTINLGNALSATVDLHVNDGNDVLNVGGGNLSGYFPQIFNGGDGTDRITFDNHLDSTNRIWDMRNNEVIFGGLISLFTTNFEEVGVLAGSGQDEFDFKGVLGQGFNVDGGPGADDFVLGYQGSVYFNNAVTLLGGAGADLFTVNDAAVSAFTTPLVMDGGAAADFNGLVVNEPLVSGFVLGPGYFIPNGQGTFVFANMLSTVITGNSADNTFTVYSAGVDSIGTFRIDGGSGNDTFHLVPQPSGYTFKGLTINGQPGVDTLYLDATAFSTNESYTIGSNVIQIARASGAETINCTSMNEIALSAGSGNDSITMNQYSAGIPVTVNGGFGDDTMNVGSGNLSANITSIAAFTFNGQSGFDRFNLNNASETGAWQYIRDIGSIRADRLTAPVGYFVTLGETGIEEMTVNAGPAGDAFYTRAIEPGASIILNAGAGLDGLVVADSTQNLQGIQGLIRYNAGVDGGNMRVSDNADTTGDTGHLTASTLGAAPGDNLFGPGGSLEFSNIVNSSLSSGITLNLGSGADAIFAQPLASAQVTINAGNPTSAPGDALNLVLATAQNYVVNGTPANGNVTSTNLMTLSYTGFETGPNISDANFDGDGDVDGNDFLAWQRGLGKPAAMNADGDADGDGDVDGGDLALWRGQFGMAGAAIAASDAAVASLAKPTSRAPISAELIDLAIARELIGHSMDDRLHRGHAFVDEGIVFDGPTPRVQPESDATKYRDGGNETPPGRRRQEPRVANESSIRSLSSARLDAIVLDTLFSRLL